MIRYIRDVRFIPIALIASACLLLLKTADLMLDRGYIVTVDNQPAVEAEPSIVRTTADVPPPSADSRSWAQQMFNFPGGSGSPPPADTSGLPTMAAITPTKADRLDPDVTGSVAARPTEKAAKAEGSAAAESKGEGDGKDAKNPKEAKPQPAGTFVPLDGAGLPSTAERALLERLQERRQQLDSRARELDIREGLVQAAEKHVEAKLAELNEVKSQITAATEKKNEVETARFKGLVTMYENMKPRDAAKIFERLETGVLVEVASQINPRRMSDILAQMSADSAERLTIELAHRAQGEGKGSSSVAGELPKIEGRPTSP